MSVFNEAWPVAEPLILGKRKADYYKNQAGKRLQSVTTIIKHLGWNARVLMKWANKQGLKGVDIDQYKPEADVGTICHYLAECYAKSIMPNLTKIPEETQVEKDYKKDVVERAQTAFLGFVDWVSRTDPKWVSNELKLVSEKYQFAGTIDAVALVNGTLTLIDFKTSKGVYSDHYIQVSAYRELLREHNFDIKDVLLLQFDKETGNFMPHVIPEEILTPAWEVFQMCQKLTPYQKLLDKFSERE